MRLKITTCAILGFLVVTACGGGGKVDTGGDKQPPTGTTAKEGASLSSSQFTLKASYSALVSFNDANQIFIYREFFPADTQFDEGNKRIVIPVEEDIQPAQAAGGGVAKGSLNVGPNVGKSVILDLSSKDPRFLSDGVALLNPGTEVVIGEIILTREFCLGQDDRIALSLSQEEQGPEKRNTLNHFYAAKRQRKIRVGTGQRVPPEEPKPPEEGERITVEPLRPGHPCFGVRCPEGQVCRRDEDDKGVCRPIPPLPPGHPCIGVRCPEGQACGDDGACHLIPRFECPPGEEFQPDGRCAARRPEPPQPPEPPQRAGEPEGRGPAPEEPAPNRCAGVDCPVESFCDSQTGRCVECARDDRTNQYPRISKISATKGRVGVIEEQHSLSLFNTNTFSLRVESTDPDGDPVVISPAEGVELPRGVTYNATDATFSGVLPLPIGNYPIAVKLEDKPQENVGRNARSRACAVPVSREEVIRLQVQENHRPEFVGIQNAERDDQNNLWRVTKVPNGYTRLTVQSQDQDVGQVVYCEARNPLPEGITLERSPCVLSVAFSLAARDYRIHLKLIDSEIDSEEGMTNISLKLRVENLPPKGFHVTKADGTRTNADAIETLSLSLIRGIPFVGSLFATDPEDGEVPCRPRKEWARDQNLTGWTYDSNESRFSWTENSERRSNVFHFDCADRNGDTFFAQLRFRVFPVEECEGPNVPPNRPPTYLGFAQDGVLHANNEVKIGTNKPQNIQVLFEDTDCNDRMEPLETNGIPPSGGIGFEGDNNQILISRNALLGRHTITLIARDSRGLETRQPITLDIDNLPPERLELLHRTYGVGEFVLAEPPRPMISLLPNQEYELLIRGEDPDERGAISATSDCPFISPFSSRLEGSSFSLGATFMANENFMERVGPNTSLVNCFFTVTDSDGGSASLPATFVLRQ